MSSIRAKIVKYIFDHGESSATEVARGLKLPLGKVRPAFHDLRKTSVLSEPVAKWGSLLNLEPSEAAYIIDSTHTSTRHQKEMSKLFHKYENKPGTIEWCDAAVKVIGCLKK